LTVKIIGLDPSLSSTGWGIIEVQSNRLQYVADGFIPTNPKQIKIPIANNPFISSSNQNVHTKPLGNISSGNSFTISTLL
jgi:hypothetical protein